MDFRQPTIPVDLIPYPGRQMVTEWPRYWVLETIERSRPHYSDDESALKKDERLPIAS